MDLLAGISSFDYAAYVIIAGSFLAAFCNAAFSSGGALIVLAATSAVLPIAAIVPIHSTLLIGSTVSRTVLFREYIDWGIVKPFLVGSVIAVAIASRIYVDLPDTVIAMSIGALMLVAIWLPAVSWRPRMRHPWAVVGFVHSFVSTLFAYGALLQAIILHTRLRRREIVGTMAASVTGMSLLKISGYTLNGFDYRPYLTVIGLSILAAFVGTWAGKLVIDRISEAVFRFVYRVLVTVTAIRLLYVAFTYS